jgi:hypothetical protein
MANKLCLVNSLLYNDFPPIFAVRTRPQPYAAVRIPPLQSVAWIGHILRVIPTRMYTLIHVRDHMTFQGTLDILRKVTNIDN